MSACIPLLEHNNLDGLSSHGVLPPLLSECKLGDRNAGKREGRSWDRTPANIRLFPGLVLH